MRAGNVSAAEGEFGSLRARLVVSPSVLLLSWSTWSAIEYGRQITFNSVF